MLCAVIAVPNAETQFDIDEFNDLYARTKPTLYIKMADIFSVHHLVAAETTSICPGQDDILRDVIRELGSAKTNENELMNVSKSEICLTLNPKLHNVEGTVPILLTQDVGHGADLVCQTLMRKQKPSLWKRNVAFCT